MQYPLIGIVCSGKMKKEDVEIIYNLHKGKIYNFLSAKPRKHEERKYVITTVYSNLHGDTRINVYRNGRVFILSKSLKNSRKVSKKYRVYNFRLDYMYYDIKLSRLIDVKGFSKGFKFVKATSRVVFDSNGFRYSLWKDKARIRIPANKSLNIALEHLKDIIRQYGKPYKIETMKNPYWLEVKDDAQLERIQEAMRKRIGE